jgi:sulfite exporter TauE/SafE
MEPIISPWIIYVVSLADKISTVAIVTAFIIGTAMAFAALHVLTEENSESAKSFFKKACIPFIVCITIVIFVPDKQTMMTMVAVQYITPDNISVVQGNVVDFVGQIAQAVKENVK